MPPAARVGDPTNHPGVVTGPGVPTVLVGGMLGSMIGAGGSSFTGAGHRPIPGP